MIGEPDYDGDGNVGSYCGGGGACSGDLSDFLQMVTATSSFSRVGCVSDTPPCHCRDLPLLEDKPGLHRSCKETAALQKHIIGKLTSYYHSTISIYLHKSMASAK